jgi:MoxR-like ATPase
MTLEAPLSTTAASLKQLSESISRVILGKDEAIRLCLVGLLAEGHVLLEDVPGTGKTTLARALARSIDVSFRRIQFTSDLLPSDVLGVSVHSAAEGRFQFNRGPIFGNIVLADELNRTSPRTQSALLECMNEGRVSVDGETHELPRPFLVIATQNPLEFEGTYPLPESQLDRFLLRIRMGYPEPEVERELLRARISGDPMDELRPVVSGEDMVRASAMVKQVRVDDSLLDYALGFLEATRNSADFLLGASPRAGLGWVRAAQATALLDGRDYCIPDDFKQLALPVLAHRVVTRVASHHGGAQAAEDALLALQDEVEVPLA